MSAKRVEDVFLPWHGRHTVSERTCMSLLFRPPVPLHIGLVLRLELLGQLLPIGFPSAHYGRM